MKAFFKGLWARIKGIAAQAFVIVQESGLDDVVMTMAVEAVRKAQEDFTDNAERREWVVQFLKDKGVPEGVARTALQLALAWVRKQTS